MKNTKRITKRILQKENTQSKPSETTVRCNNPDLLDHALDKIHPVLGVIGDVLQSKGKPLAKIETKQSGLGQTIVEQVKSVNKSVEEIIKTHTKVPNELERTKSDPKFKPRPKPKPKAVITKYVAYPEVKSVREVPVNYPSVEPIMPPPPLDDPNNPYASLPEQTC